MSETPKVTIIMATYNRTHFILESLVSIQNQTFKKWECLIIDDGGTDNTLEALQPILKLDNRFQFLKRTGSYKKGLPGCRNYGLDLAKGEYIIYFDDDDFVHPDNLKTCIEAIETYNVDFCHYQKLGYLSQEPPIESKPISIQQYLTKADIEKVVTQQIGMASCTVMWKKHCFENCRFNENLLYAEEWECYSRLISENFKGIIINNILYFNRKHANSNTGEFYKNDIVRINSKKEAIRLVAYNIASKNLLTPSLLKYLAGLAIGFRDTRLLNDIIAKAGIKTNKKLFLHLKYWLFPIWKVYKITGKKLNYK
ncbi:MAG: glycosyltransferase family 2 protein [Lutibacter sp.]|nr:glycosyltransferase family 2 protein [Lutibacter sp.]